MFYYPVTFGSLLIVFLIVWILGRTDKKEELNAEARAALDEFNTIYNEMIADSKREEQRLNKLVEEKKQQKKLLSQLDALKDDLPKEVQVKLDT